jgi:8-oxo-dGTP diphosphatase
MDSPQQVFEHLTQGLPHFEDGRINFTGVQKAPVLNAVVYWDGKILLLKRSHKVSAYRGLWNCVSGFIDQPRPIADFARQEVSEELSINDIEIRAIKLAEPYEVDDRSIDRVWVVYPVLVELGCEPHIKLDWEHTDHAWIKSGDLSKFDHVIDLEKSVARALNLI